MSDVSVPTRVKIKVCGLTSVADALACAGAGADWLGLNFHPASPRHVLTEPGVGYRLV